MHLLSARENRLEAARRRKVVEFFFLLAIFLLLLCQKSHRVRPRSEDGSVVAS